MSDPSLGWASLPGSFDVHQTWARFPSDNRWGIPTLAPYPGPPPAYLVPYGTRVQPAVPVPGGALHFYRDDHRFERVWNRPWTYLPVVQRAGCVLTPDFSLYRDWPAAIQIYNVYRARWCGAFWAGQGVTVIPAVSWTLPDSYDFAFAGLPRDSVLAISAQGVRHRENRAHFVRGYTALIERIAPRRVLVYGTLPPVVANLVPTQTYPAQWRGIWSAQRAQRAGGSDPPQD
jgi:hypothetical protein